VLPRHFLSKTDTVTRPWLDPACPAAVSALEHDPFYAYISAEFGADPMRRRSALAAYFDYSIRQGAQIGRVVHLEEADIGVAVWLLPQSDDVQERERSRKRAYLHAVLGEYGCERYERIVAYMSARAGTVVGRGLGARLLAPTLAEADAAMAVCYLETFNPRSLHFYEHLGFVTRAEFDEPATRAQYTIMVRAPRNNPGDRDRRYRDNVTDGS